LTRLERWRSEVADMFRGAAPVHPVLVALRDTVTRCGLTQKPFLDLIAANVQDQRVAAYENWPDLQAYCALSAAPVGRMVLAVFGMGGAAAEHLSDDVCIGLQLANFAQDVSVDAAKGRTYLLQSEIRSGGVTDATKAHCARARSLLASGEQLELMAPGLLRFQLALYRFGGLAIVAAIERERYRTQTFRPTVSAAAKAMMLVRAGMRSLHGNGHVDSIEPA
jgi:phytoene/squalene synthetase